MTGDTHLDRGTLVAVRDGEPTDDGGAGHVSRCPTCRAALVEAERRSRTVEALLATLDDPSVDAAAIDRARVRVGRRLAAEPVGRRQGGATSSSPRGSRHAAERTGTPGGRLPASAIRWAAGLLLFVAGGLSALPGSPLRRALSSGDADVAVPANPPTPGLSPGAVVAIDPAPAGVLVTVDPAGRTESIEVIWTDEATVRVGAPPGSGFTRGEGTITVRAASGVVRLTVPRAGPPVEVRYEGRTLLVRDSTGVRTPVPPSVASEDRLVFSVATP